VSLYAKEVLLDDKNTKKKVASISNVKSSI